MVARPKLQCRQRFGQRPAERRDRIFDGEKGGEFLDLLRAVAGDLDWTFLSPSAMFVPGERSGKFRLGKDRLLTNDKGKQHLVRGLCDRRRRRTGEAATY